MSSSNLTPPPSSSSSSSVFVKKETDEIIERHISTTFGSTPVLGELSSVEHQLTPLVHHPSSRKYTPKRYVYSFFHSAKFSRNHIIDNSDNYFFSYRRLLFDDNDKPSVKRLRKIDPVYISAKWTGNKLYCCNSGCKVLLLSNLESSKQLTADEIQQSRLAFCNMDETEKSKWILNWVNMSWNSHSYQPNYNWNGIPICRTTWIDIYGITFWKLNHVIQAHNRGQKLPKSHSLIANRITLTRMSVTMG